MPSVRVAGMDLPANAIKEGACERVELTLLSIDEEKLPISLNPRGPVSLAAGNPSPAGASDRVERRVDDRWQQPHVRPYASA